MPSTTQSLRLAETLAARLCHDLSSPLGALDNALELVVEAAGSADGAEALVLACDSARQLRQRLRLLRAAWAADPGPLDATMISELAAGLPNWHRLTLDLEGFDRAVAFAPLAGRVVLNMILLAAAALPMGGAIALSGAAGRDVLLTVAGPRAAWPAGLAGVLLNPDSAMDDMQPGTLTAPMAALLAAEAGLSLRLLLAVGEAAGPAPLLLTLR